MKRCWSDRQTKRAAFQNRRSAIVRVERLFGGEATGPGSMEVTSPFVGRRPWVAALVGLVLGPVIGMLYLGRGRMALGYIGIFVAIYALPLFVAHIGLLPFDAEHAIFGLMILFRLGGAGYCYGVAAREQGAIPLAWFARWYSVLGLGVVLPLGIHFFVLEPFNMPSASMEPTFAPGDYIIASKLSYLFGEPQRGDIAVFWVSKEEVPYVKRLIGLPGDRVQMKAGSLYLNDQRVPRDEVEEPQTANDVGELYREKLTFERSYLIREVSDEARYDETEVYEVPEGHYFFLGDNRDNSLDSRVLDWMGFVPREAFIGRIWLICWNREAQKFRFVVPE